jgi:MEDS: MEthanogen/methylotroph, DcmR Sensory domain
LLVESVARFIGAALGAGDAAVVIATRSHLRALEHLLRVRGLDLDIARIEGRYVPLDVDDALGRIMRRDLPDPKLFDELIGTAVAAAADGQRILVHAFGEMAPVLWSRGNQPAAMQMDQLWSELAAAVPFERWDARS